MKAGAEYKTREGGLMSSEYSDLTHIVEVQDFEAILKEKKRFVGKQELAVVFFVRRIMSSTELSTMFLRYA